MGFSQPIKSSEWYFPKKIFPNFDWLNHKKCFRISIVLITIFQNFDCLNHSLNHNKTRSLCYDLICLSPFFKTVPQVHIHSAWWRAFWTEGRSVRRLWNTCWPTSSTSPSRCTTNWRTRTALLLNPPTRNTRILNRTKSRPTLAICSSATRELEARKMVGHFVVTTSYWGRARLSTSETNLNFCYSYL